MTRYSAGADFERKLKNALLTHACVAYVVRSAGSHGVADIVALRHARQHRGRDCVLFQCKTHGAISEKERLALGQVARFTKMAAAVVGRGIGTDFRIMPVDAFGRFMIAEGLDLDRFLHRHLHWIGECNGKNK